MIPRARLIACSCSKRCSSIASPDPPVPLTRWSPRSIPPSSSTVYGSRKKKTSRPHSSAYPSSFDRYETADATLPSLLTSMLAGMAYVTILGSVSVSTIPTVGMFEMLHSLINARFSEGLRTTTMSGRWDPARMGLGPKLRRWLLVLDISIVRTGLDRIDLGGLGPGVNE